MIRASDIKMALAGAHHFRTQGHLRTRSRRRPQQIMSPLYPNKREYDRTRSRDHYTPLYKSIHTDEWYLEALVDPSKTLRCAWCHEVKHVSQYTKKRLYASGFRAECKACAAAYKRNQPKGVSTAVRWEVWERDDFRCQKCGRRRDLVVDHIIPRARGGSEDTSNLQTLCRSCNVRKGHR